MSELFNITHEGGDLSEYDTVIIGTANNVTANSDSALAGTNFGLDVFLIGNSTGGSQGIKEFTTSSSQFRIRWYLDFSSLSIDTGANTRIFGVRTDFNSVNNIRAFLHFNTPNYELRFSHRDEVGGFVESSQIVISKDSTHLIELHATKGSNNATDDSTLDIYIDGVFKETITTILFDNWGFEDFQIGAIGSPSTVSGNIYHDEVKANDDGSEIGPVTFSDGIRPRYSSADYNTGLRARHGPYRGRYR